MTLKKIAIEAAKTAAKETYNAILKIAQQKEQNGYKAVQEIQNYLSSRQIEAKVEVEPLIIGVPLSGEKVVITVSQQGNKYAKALKEKWALLSIGRKYNVKKVELKDAGGGFAPAKAPITLK